VNRILKSSPQFTVFLSKTCMNRAPSHIPASDLILNRDGSIYHLHLLPEDVADTIILAGDPGRVARVSKHFDQIRLKKSNREFLTHTGTYRGREITVMATGIGTDNIDIVLNETDALVNVDLEGRKLKKAHRKLRFVRLGTCGALSSDIEPGDRVLSGMACGFDPLYHFYRDSAGIAKQEMTKAFMKHVRWPDLLPAPYFIHSPGSLSERFEPLARHKGVTISTPGFYGPQARRIRLDPFDNELIEKITTFRYDHWKVTNFEMECSALYALAGLLGHEAITLCVAVANRITETFLDNYQRHIDRMILDALQILSEND